MKIPYNWLLDYFKWRFAAEKMSIRENFRINSYYFRVNHYYFRINSYYFRAKISKNLDKPSQISYFGRR